MRYTTRPLSGWDGPRTPVAQRRSRWTFKAGWGDTLALLEYELRYLDATDVVLEADYREQDLRLDGMPKSNARVPEDPAVRISFGSRHGPLIYQCDSCAVWQHNIRSIALGLQALRAVDRYGITHRSEQYTGWKQIGGGPSTALVPDPPMDRKGAAEILTTWAYPGAQHVLANHGRATALADGLLDLDFIARRAQRHTHPDTGGSAEKFVLVQRALAVLRGGS